MQDRFDDEKAVIWDKYQDVLIEKRRVESDLEIRHRDLETIHFTMAKVVKALDSVRLVVSDLSQDVQILVDRHGGREHISCSSIMGWAKTGEGCEMVALCESEDLAQSIVTAMQHVSSSLASCGAQVPVF